MSNGFIYVMINPAMPGLVKVGKTTRTTQERLSELSSATGVPSPFILAFEQPTSDCHAAESWVHAELERHGYRVSSSREFFRAPLHEIIAIITLAATKIQSTSTETISTDEIDIEPPESSIINDLSTLADAYRDGTGDVLKNQRQALGLYEQAAKIGDTYSCQQAAKILKNGCTGIKPNITRSLEYLKKAIALDPKYNWDINGEIAEIFSEANQPISALPYWKKFAHQLDTNSSRYLAARLWRYCFYVVERGLPHEIDDQKIGLFGPLLIDKINFASSSGLISKESALRTKNFVIECVGKI